MTRDWWFENWGKKERKRRNPWTFTLQRPLPVPLTNYDRFSFAARASNGHRQAEQPSPDWLHAWHHQRYNIRDYHEKSDISISRTHWTPTRYLTRYVDTRQILSNRGQLKIHATSLREDSPCISLRHQSLFYSHLGQFHRLLIRLEPLRARHSANLLGHCHFHGYTYFSKGPFSAVAKTAKVPSLFLNTRS